MACQQAGESKESSKLVEESGIGFIMEANQDEVQLYEELKGFLVSNRTDLRTAATDAVLQQVLGSDNDDNLAKVVQFGLVPLLAKNCSHPDGLVSVNALKALVYMSSHGTTANKVVYDLLSDAAGMNRMIEIVLSSPNRTDEYSQNSSNDKNDSIWRQRVNFAMSLLANMTRTEEGAIEMVGRTFADRAIPKHLTNNHEVSAGKLPTKPSLELILARYVSKAFVLPTDYNSMLSDAKEASLDSHEGDPYQHFAAVLMNTTQVEQGRQFLLKIHRRKNEITKEEEESTVLQNLLNELKSPNPIRRRGTAGTIKNCVLDRDSAWWFLNVVKITKHLLYPLAGPEELDIDEKQGLDPDLWLEGPDKKREPDHLTRLYLVQSILILCCSGRQSREKLRLERVYVILKWADMVEEQEDVSEMIYECVNYLRGDEPGTVEGSSDKFVQDSYRKPCAARQVGASDENFDDID